MNIFVLDEDPKLAAQYHCDKHVVKMILETAQLLSTAARHYGIDYGYKSTHYNHPCSIWARRSAENIRWLHSLGVELCNEYTSRYGKVHASESLIRSFPFPKIWEHSLSNALTPFAQAMPDEYKQENVVEAYRAYYLGEKKDFAKWKNGNIPPWWIK